MDQSVLREWWFERQGLGAQRSIASPAEVLERVGWARSVGGSNPYLTLFARARCSRADVDADVARLHLHELPSARGCTYVIPKSQFAVALKVSQGSGGDSAEISTAKRHLGVTESELDNLCKAVCDALNDEPLDPERIKDRVGNAVRNLGPEGKKRGMTTTLSLALRQLQSRGEIRRSPIGGRLDQQRYGYVRWRDNPMGVCDTTSDEAFAELAKLYFHWIGAASAANFQWFSGLGVRAVKSILESLELVAIDGTDLFAFPEDADSLGAFSGSKEPRFAVVSGLDSMLLLRRDLKSLIDDADLDLPNVGQKGVSNVGGIQDLSNGAILDRGRLVGIWEYDSFAGEIVYVSYIGKSSAMRQAVLETETFIREQLGDARSFSLDSPESRRPIIEKLRLLSAA